MSALAELRAELAAVLRDVGGLNAADRDPARLAPPVAVVTPGAPYVSNDGAPFGALTVRLRVRLVVPTGPAALDALETMLEAALEALDSTGRAWRVLEAGEPYTLVAGSLAFPALDVDLATSLTI